ncbi:hypothetical protein N7468_003789 [Penicillium chermesinum]|uniref:Uncharacterized protein n=1 Tax=Penicillium chermesinum TaxID=63820 RepID=A0A9W9TRY2_9EURO|nr:uncharacterized protein N7468_003789 [Penicillium chermesinum]KAJ5239170.1 hypothetical protein N7468_003789 [Penicillium chermesinum]
MDCLPDGYIVRSFSRLSRLRVDAETILQLLQENQGGNQWLVVLGLPKSTIRKQDEGHGILGNVNYRFQWEGTTGLIQIALSPSHELVTGQLHTAIDRQLYAMGIEFDNAIWLGHTTYKPTPTRGKQGDQVFVPPSRRPIRGQLQGWPTLVI